MVKFQMTIPIEVAHFGHVDLKPTPNSQLISIILAFAPKREDWKERKEKKKKKTKRGDAKRRIKTQVQLKAKEWKKYNPEGRQKKTFLQGITG